MSGTSFVVEDQVVVKKFNEVVDAALGKPRQTYNDVSSPNVDTNEISECDAFRSNPVMGREISEFFLIATDGKGANTILIPKEDLPSSVFGRLLRGETDIKRLLYEGSKNELYVVDWNDGVQAIESATSYIEKLHLALCSIDQRSALDRGVNEYLRRSIS